MNSFKNSHHHAPKYQTIWSIQALFSYYRASSLIYSCKEGQFILLQTKTIALIMFSVFFFALERYLYYIKNKIIEKECLWIHTVLKSHQNALSPIDILFFNKNKTIYPTSTILALIQSNEKRFYKLLRQLDNGFPASYSKCSRTPYEFIEEFRSIEIL
jgi:hypothetical protein